MFGLLSPSGKKVPRSRPWARLNLENLESRDNPSSLSLSVSYGSGYFITLTGRLTNASTVANQAVGITGVACGTTYTDSCGNYSVTLPDSGSGYVYAQTLDGLSNTASYYVSYSSSSTLTLSVTSYGPGKNVTLAGSLTNTANYANQTINITGVCTGTAVTDSNGNYSVTLAASKLGTVNAQTADGSSNVASVTLTDTAPTITNFVGVETEGDIWDFTGTVSWNESWSTMSGQIQGPPKIGTVTILATSNGTMSNGVCTGSFTEAIQLDGTQATDGSYVATVTDCWGTVSNQALYDVWQSGT
jgi:hypothetical protein